MAYEPKGLGLPIAIADSASELARKMGKRQNAIVSAISKAKERGDISACQYARFEITEEDEDETD